MNELQELHRIMYEIAPKHYVQRPIGNSTKWAVFDLQGGLVYEPSQVADNIEAAIVTGMLNESPAATWEDIQDDVERYYKLYMETYVHEH